MTADTHRLSACPGCAEPVEPADLYCGACGLNLASAAVPEADTPTVALRTRDDAPPAAAAPGRTGARSSADGGAEPTTDGYVLQPPAPRAADPRASVAAPAAPRGADGQACVACRAGRVDGDGYCENCGHAQPRERDHMEQESGPVAAVSDRGLRHHRNEDAFALATASLPDGTPVSVAVVCDGVSSATRPDEASAAASRTAADTLREALPRGTHPQTAMHEAILAAARAVDALAGEPAGAREHAAQQNAPACTLVSAVVADGLLVVGWVGDSRAYWVPDDRSAPARLTEDDSWAAQMVAAGLMSEAQAYADERAHAITGWLGADAYELEPHTASFKPDRPGVVVVCTDGLWNYAEAAEQMAEILPADAAARPLHSARVLVGHALDGGGHDNVTVALVPFPGPGTGAGSG
ncbi:PP2C family protein-serine/threonine phosphatase [Streptomyces chilikensis]|uniref:PP2C family protein-serine/threonine phosphatase n=1 Tax=Streptomyces chilikensis TaxID=1194079 RepID=UPI00140E11EB|nr:PP2C family serine/threonine-protein phosphatase [Streptomyces chilikensis]